MCTRMSDVRVVRWRKYGKDRLYVSDLSGVSLGWYDLVAQVAHAEVPERAESFNAAVRDWRDRYEGDEPAVGSSTGAPSTVPTPVALPPQLQRIEGDPDADLGRPDDLAGRRAGAMAREQAVALREAAPVRTLLARVVGVHTEERAWRIGADGEEKTAAELSKLLKKSPSWRVLHAVPVGDRRLRHRPRGHRSGRSLHV